MRGFLYPQVAQFPPEQPAQALPPEEEGAYPSPPAMW
jgi:hypothetical protein